MGRVPSICGDSLISPRIRLDEKIREAHLCLSEDLSESSGVNWASAPLMEKLEEMEKRMVHKSLQLHRWNKTKAAEALGVAKSTLFAKFKLYQLEEPNVAQ